MNRQHFDELSDADVQLLTRLSERETELGVALRRLLRKAEALEADVEELDSRAAWCPTCGEALP